MTLYDMHAHMGFTAEPEVLARKAQASDIEALSATVCPDEYERVSRMLAPWPQFRVGLGLHPWWLADRRCGEDDIAHVEALAKDAPFIAEIGLDFARSRDTEEQRRIQIPALKRILCACRDAEEGKLLSIHAVHATKDVLDLLEQTNTCTCHHCIMHWFSGTQSELTRAKALGCYFSVGARMIASKHGRALIAEIPTERLLIETDEPAAEGEPWDAQTWQNELIQTMNALTDIRPEPADELSAHIAETSALLLARHP